METDVDQLSIRPDNHLYFGIDGGEIYALSLSDGRRKTNYPIVVSGVSFKSAPFFAQDNILYLYNNYTEILYSLELSERIRWECDVKEERFAKMKKLEELEGSVSPLIGPDRNIYVGVSDGVYIIRRATRIRLGIDGAEIIGISEVYHKKNIKVYGGRTIYFLPFSFYEHSNPN